MKEEGAFSIIDAYLRLAAQGEKIVAFRADECYWRDLGRPESVLEAGRDLASGRYTGSGDTVNTNPMRRVNKSPLDSSGFYLSSFLMYSQSPTSMKAMAMRQRPSPMRRWLRSIIASLPAFQVGGGDLHADLNILIRRGPAGSYGW